MTAFTEGPRTAEFIISEGNGTISREAGTLVSGQNLTAAAVLGTITASGKYTIHDPAAVNGAETASAILYADVDASAADADCVVIARDAEVNGDLLTYIAGISAGNKTAAIADLAGKGIIVR